MATNSKKKPNNTKAKGRPVKEEFSTKRVIGRPVKKQPIKKVEVKKEKPVKKVEPVIEVKEWVEKKSKKAPAPKKVYVPKVKPENNEPIKESLPESNVAPVMDEQKVIDIQSSDLHSKLFSPEAREHGSAFEPYIPPYLS